MSKQPKPLMIYSTIILKWDEQNPVKLFEHYQLGEVPLLKRERTKEACSASSKGKYPFKLKND